eukprot:scaffold37639_cov17-Tisochrysis_lutea.AAC.1
MEAELHNSQLYVRPQALSVQARFKEASPLASPSTATSRTCFARGCCLQSASEFGGPGPSRYSIMMRAHVVAHPQLSTASQHITSMRRNAFCSVFADASMGCKCVARKHAPGCQSCLRFEI